MADGLIFDIPVELGLELMAVYFLPEHNLAIAALQDTDRQRRRRATHTLAQHLADRLGCFEITGNGLGDDVGMQALLYR